MAISVDCGFSIHNMRGPVFPVLLAIPHAGRDYPVEVTGNLRLSPSALFRLEDRYVDLLARAGISGGIPTIIAHRARAWIDLNREEGDVDPAMIDGWVDGSRLTPSRKQLGGLGLIPRRLSGQGEIWKSRIPVSDLHARIENYHRPYHAQLDACLAELRHRFGFAILLDLHSMPPIVADDGRLPPQFVVGDIFGRSAAGPYSEIIISKIASAGFRVALNHPYSGDHILRRHGNIRRNIHAIQLEVDRSLYLDGNLAEPNGGEHYLSKLIHELLLALAGAQGSGLLEAAE